jgi:hypothetical protein
MTGWHAVLLLTSLLYLGCGSGRPTTQASPPAVPPATVPPEPAAADEPPTQAPQSKGPESCAEVSIGLDLQALPQPASDADVRMYTLGQADDFRQAFPTATRVEIYVQDGVAAFTAKLYSASEPDLLALCASIAEEFVAGVPGHPLAIGEPGGSIIEPCAWCHEESDNASPDLESTIPEPECLASFAAPVCADATENMLCERDMCFYPVVCVELLPDAVRSRPGGSCP